MQVALEVDSLERLLQGHQKSMHETQTRLMEHWLAKAEADCVTAPEAVVDLHDPWENVVAVGPQQSATSAPHEVLRYQIMNYASNNYPSDKGITITSSVNVIESTSPIPPKYKSIVRLGPNVLAENDKTLKYLPYFPEEELGAEWTWGEDFFNELKERYDNRVADLPARRQCSEKAEFWRESVEDLMKETGVEANDIMYYLLLSDGELRHQRPRGIAQKPLLSYLDRNNQCQACSVVFRRRHWLGVGASLRRPVSDISLAVAGLLCQAFSNIANFSIWHIVSTNAEMRQIYQDIKTKFSINLQPTQGSKASELRCMVCYIHDCPGHGTFSEQDPNLDENEESFDTDSESDNELGHNIRKIVNSTATTRLHAGPPSLCGVFCCEDSIRLRELLGLDNEGNVSGLFNTQYRETSDTSALIDTEACGRDCFWQKSSRRDTTVHELLKKKANRFVGWREEDVTIYTTLLEIFGKKRRGACAIAAACSRTCVGVWEELLVDIHTNHQPHPSNDQPTKATQVRDLRYWLENSNTHLHDERAPFLPCSHDGPCENNDNCSCYKGGISCEHFCKCPPDCGRRFRGCKCRQSSKACFNDDRCDCFVLNRECDPWLCGCGVLEVLDPANRHDENICRGKCKNAGLQRDVPKRTIKNHSEVQGWGLFAGEDIRAHEFIGEYKGEIISSAESDRRGTVYHHRGVEYLFKLNREQEIDSTRAGNKMRFINNSQKPRNINCFARKSLCAGVQRIGLYAKRDIKAGEEFFFHYGYPDSVTKHFWEKGEKPGQGSGAGDESDSDVSLVPLGKKNKGKGKLVAVKEPLKKRRKRKKGVAVPVSRKAKTDISSSFASNSSGRSRKRGFAFEDEDVTPNTGSLSLGSQLDGMDAIPEIAESSDDNYYSNEISGESVSSSPTRSIAEAEAEDEDEDEDEELDDLPVDDEESDADMASTSSPEIVRRRRSGQAKKNSKKVRIGRLRDTRYGGQAQKAGWITRKKNMERARKREQKQRGKAVRKKRNKKRGMK